MTERRKEMDVLLKVQKLKKSFGNTQVLHGLDFEVRRGDIVGYIGPNGSGKSTTVKLILGLLSGYEGEIEIFGENIRSGDIGYKRRIGYVPEVAELYETLTPREYLRFLSRIYETEEADFLGRAQDMLDIFGIAGSFDSRISSFSKGMKQKLVIVCSMVHNPDILFLDEPLSGLDANSVAVFKEVIDSLARSGKTIFYSSHIMELVEKISSRIILLKNGIILADRPMQDLVRENRDHSLEEVFNELTGFEQKHDLAGRFVDSVLGGERHE